MAASLLNHFLHPAADSVCADLQRRVLAACVPHLCPAPAGAWTTVASSHHTAASQEAHGPQMAFLELREHVVTAVVNL